MSISQLEDLRLRLQEELDRAKDATERNRLGQFATPAPLAHQIVACAHELLGGSTRPIRFLDPAFGTGSFYSALLRTFPRKEIARATGFEVDPHYAKPAERLWKDTLLDLRLADFTRTTPPGDPSGRYDLIICNPPYVRHHHIPSSEKRRLQARAMRACGVPIGGLAGLYCYFLGLSHAWLAPGGVAGWLIPSEFMDVNYGKTVKHYLLTRVTLLRIHRFSPEDVQFGDALVSSTVVWFRMAPPPGHQSVEFTYGGTLGTPKVRASIPGASLQGESKWTRFPLARRRARQLGPTIGDFFTIKRGLATGGNDFFILTREKAVAHGLWPEHLLPILPSPRVLGKDEVLADEFGNPRTELRLFLLACSLPEEVVETRYPTVWRYLQTGKPHVSGRYLCRHRAPWYVQENRPPAPFLCTYMGRGARGKSPFRFILNHSKATAANVYLLLYPKEHLQDALDAEPRMKHRVWRALCGIARASLVAEGRVYGGGLFKLEPKELGAVPAAGIAGLLPESARHRLVQATLFERGGRPHRDSALTPSTTR